MGTVTFFSGLLASLSVLTFEDDFDETNLFKRKKKIHFDCV